MKFTKMQASKVKSLLIKGHALTNNKHIEFIYNQGKFFQRDELSEWKVIAPYENLGGSYHDLFGKHNINITDGRNWG